MDLSRIKSKEVKEEEKKRELELLGQTFQANLNKCLKMVC